MGNNEGTVTKDCQAYQEAENCFSSCDSGSNTNFNADRRYNQFPDTTQVVGINPDQIDQIKDFMMNHGSMVIAMYADGGFFSYSGGVYTEPAPGNSVNHALVCVGWEGSNWICKNSWGTGFGESGFIKFPMGQNVINEMEAQWTGMQFLDCAHEFDAHANQSCRRYTYTYTCTSSVFKKVYFIMKIGYFALFVMVFESKDKILTIFHVFL